jgi:hypothetical protein
LNLEEIQVFSQKKDENIEANDESQPVNSKIENK